MKIISAEAELESSFVSDLRLYHLVLEYSQELTLYLCKEAIVCPVFLLQIGHVLQGERI